MMLTARCLRKLSTEILGGAMVWAAAADIGDAQPGSVDENPVLDPVPGPYTTTMIASENPAERYSIAVAPVASAERVIVMSTRPAVACCVNTAFAPPDRMKLAMQKLKLMRWRAGGLDPQNKRPSDVIGEGEKNGTKEADSQAFVHARESLVNATGV